MYLVPDLLEEIFLGLPPRSVVRFRTVSKQWRSILESPRLAERRRRRMMNAQTKTKIMAAGDKSRTLTWFKEDEEVEIVYLQSDVTSRPSLSCDGLVCIPVPGWVNVFNPSTGELLRFSSGRDPPVPHYADYYKDHVFPGYWRMGFGRDNVSGSYKIVRMGFIHHLEIHRCEILDVNIGTWQRLSPPPYALGYRRKSSTCVNGSIYWVEIIPPHKFLALDLHTQEWRDVGLPLGALRSSCEVANLENRLALAATYIENYHWNVKIWSMGAPEETWSVVYSISLSSVLPHLLFGQVFPLWYWTRPVAVSKKGNLFFEDSNKSLFKYYPETGEVRCIAAEIWMISPFVENLVPLGRLDSKTYGLKHLDHVPLSSRKSNFFRRMELKSPIILVTTLVVTLVMFRYCSRLCRS